MVLGYVELKVSSKSKFYLQISPTDELIFHRSCEITLELMRQYADTLITIIEVLLYDPLYQWQISPQKALQLQQQFDKTNTDSATPASFRSSGRSSGMLPSTVANNEPFSTGNCYYSWKFSIVAFVFHQIQIKWLNDFYLVFDRNYKVLNV